MGVEACKNCHKAKASGEQHNKWKEWEMSKAYETLAGDKAKETAKKAGVDEKVLDKKFDKKNGVQCESCHGPAEKHVKARLAADDEDEKTAHANAKKEMPLPDKKVCLNCHNEESPNIEASKHWNKEKKEFEVEKAFKDIDHHNPKWEKEKKEN